MINVDPKSALVLKFLSLPERDARQFLDEAGRPLPRAGVGSTPRFIMRHALEYVVNEHGVEDTRCMLDLFVEAGGR